MEKTPSATLPTFEKTEPYSIPLDYYREGIRAFQKRYVLRKNTIFICIFTFLLLSFLVAAFQDPTNACVWVLILVNLTSIFLLWYNPRKQRSLLMQAVWEMEFERFTASNDGRVLCIQLEQTPEEREENPIQESRVYLADAFVEDMGEFYLVCDRKVTFYVLPKQAIAG